MYLMKGTFSADRRPVKPVSGRFHCGNTVYTQQPGSFVHLIVIDSFNKNFESLKGGRVMSQFIKLTSTL